MFENCATATAWSSGVNANATYYKQQTLDASTYAPQTPTPTYTMPSFGLFQTLQPSRTPGVNYTCPEETFTFEGLDPEWAFACRACMDEVATPTRQPLAVDTLDAGTIVVPALADASGYFDFLTETQDALTPYPTVTPTGSPTPTGTTPPCWVPVNLGGDLWQLSINFDGCPYPVEVQTNATVVNGYLMVVGGDLWLEVSMPVSSHHLDGFSAYFAADGGASRGVYWQVHSTVTGWSALTLLGAFPSSTWYWNYVRPWGGGGVENIDKVYFNVQTNTHAQTTYLNDFQLNFFGAYATPTPNVTNTPTSTPTPTATGSPAPTLTFDVNNWVTSQPVSADCSVPKYVDVDFKMAEAVIQPSGNNACFEVAPPLWIGFSFINSLFSTSIPEIHTGRVMVCFYGVTVQLTLWGVVLDVGTIISFVIAAFMFRWGMRQ